MTDFSPDNRATAGRPGSFAPAPISRSEETPGGSSDRDPGAAPGPTASGTAPAPSGPSPTPGPSAPPPTNGSPTSATPANGAQRLAAEVKGRIEVADEVVEKVAGLAAMEVDGVADLGGDIARALESVRERIGVGQKRGDQGVKARINGREVAIDVTIVIEYGHVVMDVARQVKNNVAVQANRMLGLRVVEVNVTVDDVKMPKRPSRRDNPDTYDDQTDEGLIPVDG